MPDPTKAPRPGPADDPLGTWLPVVLIALAVLVSTALIVVVGA
jgi:hypothetical protein